MLYANFCAIITPKVMALPPMSQHPNPIPHITTALKGPLLDIEKHILNHHVKIESWFREQWQQYRRPFYCSVDIRNAGYKVAPVDTNLYPAGFNNLNPDFMPLCIQAVQHTLGRYYPQCQQLLLLAENATSNPMYYQNLATLVGIFENAGYNIAVGSCHPDLTTSKTISLPNGKSLTLHPIENHGNRAQANGKEPCLIISNNDFSTGIPEQLKTITQTIIPHPSLGWASRRKSNHFHHYSDVCQAFGTMVDLDPWLITPRFDRAENIDFKTGDGVTELAQKVDQLLQNIHNDYQQRDIKDKPFVVVKADQGTYGLGIMMVHDASQIAALNRKQKQRMASAKGRRHNENIIIQEGVYTHETWGDNKAVAEPVVYMIDHHVVGGFYRVHTDKTSHDNLNAPGMHFEPLGFASACNNPTQSLPADAEPNRFYTYGVMGRLALLAAAKERACLSA